MNEDRQITPEPSQQQAQPPLTGSAGAALRAAREAAGLHISALAVSLKVPVKKLEALEADDLEQLPDAVFARALAATVCRTLKVDPEPILRLLPQLETPPLQVGSQAGSPRIDSHRGVSVAGLSRLPRPVLYVTVGLLIAAVLLWLVPTLKLPGLEPSGESDGVAVRTVPNLAQVEAPIAAPIPTPVAAALPEPAASAALASAPTTGASAAAVAAADPASAAASEPGIDAGAVAVFTARGSAWVQVVGADGVVHLRKTMAEGETARINGALPLSVVIGRANAVDLLVRGKSFDLSAAAKDNVARFQIK